MSDIFQRARDYNLSAMAKEAGIYPYYQPFYGRSNGVVSMEDGSEVIMLGSNDYLGLSTDPRMIAASQQAIVRYGTGCTGSPLLNGTLDLHQKLSEELADFMMKQRALITTTGFFSNTALIPSLCKRQDHVVLDRLVHASIIDGARLSNAQIHWFKHNDSEDLERVLGAIETNERSRIHEVVDGVYSKDGDIAPLPEILNVIDRYPGARIMVDDAHGYGVLGDGRGTCAHFGVTDRVDIITMTFSKSAGSQGGAILTDEVTAEYLEHNARSIIFAASLAPASTAAALEALRIIRNEPERGKLAVQKAHLLSSGLNELGYDAGSGETSIVPILTGEMFQTMGWYHELLKHGVYTNAIVPPAASERLRTSTMASHTDSQINRALDVFAMLKSVLLRDQEAERAVA